jgi:hypothetical protein
MNACPQILHVEGGYAVLVANDSTIRSEVSHRRICSPRQPYYRGRSAHLGLRTIHEPRLFFLCRCPEPALLSYAELRQVAHPPRF